MTTDQPADPEVEIAAIEADSDESLAEEHDGDAVSGVTTDDEEGAPTPTGTVPPAAGPVDADESDNPPLSERLY